MTDQEFDNYVAEQQAFIAASPAKLDTRGMTEITGANIQDVIALAYELSAPRGMGFLHYTPGPLSPEIIREAILSESWVARGVLRLDYVLGRAVKLTIKRGADDSLWIDGTSWYDHSRLDFDTLVALRNQ